jgi:hypothetical protein
LVLDERGLLEIRPLISKAEGWLSARIELYWIGNGVSEVFVEKGRIRLHAGLEFLVAMMQRVGALEVSFPEASIARRSRRVS